MRRKLPILMIALLLVVHTFLGVTVPQVSAAADQENAEQMPVVENGQEATETSDEPDALEAGEAPDSSDLSEESNLTEDPASADLVADPEQPEETESSDPADSDEVQDTNELEEQPAQNVNILTKLILTGADGALIDSVQNPGHRIQADEAIQLKYDWELPNNTYKSGDTFTFNLPEQFVIYTDIDEPLATENGQNEVGRFTVDRQGKVVLTFNDYVENHSNVTGTLQIQTEFSTEIVKGSTEVTIVTPIKGGEQTVVIQIAPQAAPALEKRGKVDATDSNSINWTLDVNKELDSFSRGMITDPTPEGLQLQKESIRVYHLQVNGDGSTVLREPLDASEYAVETLDSDKGFKLHWNKESINTAYRIEYSTQMVDQSAQYTNTAVLSGDDIEETSASATVNVKRGALLSKSVAKYDPISQTISWTVGYNLGMYIYHRRVPS
ncbi:collagen binding domain-containing protein [Paenibacillus amylolyticus]|nr:collagen binding domain-containing protein [Paenibacillus amylolyticus]WFR62764.1 collagen binding domain-containing protein [Paenibacillus amylolyticus]